MPQNPTQLHRALCLALSDRLEQAGCASYTPSDWENLVALAQSKGLAPLLFWTLKHANSGIYTAIPDDTRRQLRSIYATDLSKQVHRAQELHSILAALNEAGLPATVLKGAYLAEHVYDNIALRSMTDIDLLVHPQDMGRCDSCLCKLGYHPTRRAWIERDYASAHHHLPPYYKDGASPVEIHWSIAHPAHPATVDLRALWQRARPASIAGVPGFALSDEDLLVHLCLHTCYSNRFEGGIRNIVDIFMVVQKAHARLDWEQVIHTAGAWGIHRGVFLTLLIAQDLLSACVPAQAIESLRPHDFDPQILSLAEEMLFDNFRISINFSRLWQQSSLRQRASLVWRRIFLSPNVLSSKYPIQPDSPSLPRFYLRRLKELILRYSRLTWRVAWSSGQEKAAIERQNRLLQWLEQTNGLAEDRPLLSRE
ncbi:MAG: nucleotidyltransferase family protein [Anaerolineales bacterium]|nr:nucleotidyltransferase family protein [Anaerolineales bacterium]